MNANKTIVISVCIYAVVFLIAGIVFMNTKFTGDAAGSGMAKGLTFIYGLGLFFLLAIILTIVNVFSLGNVTHQWIKFFAFVPLALPVLIFAFEFLGLGRQNEISIDEQEHWLVCEIRSASDLGDATLLFRSIKRSSVSKLKFLRKEEGFNVYEKRNFIYYEEDRSLSLRRGEWAAPAVHLDIPVIPYEIPFTEWQTLFKSQGEDSLHVEYRYMIVKSENAD